MDTVRYYNEYDQPFGCLSNYAPVGFELDGVWWPSSEHCYHSYKFNGESVEHQDARRLIYLATTPHDAKRIAHRLDVHKRPDWDAVKDDVMRRIVLRKFQSSPTIALVLLQTGDAEIVEASPDYHWGCGENGTGENMLGKILSDVRSQLRRMVE